MTPESPAFAPDTAACPHCDTDVLVPLYADSAVCPACEWLFRFARTDIGLVAWLPWCKPPIAVRGGEVVDD